LKQALDEFKKEVDDNPRFYDSYWRAGNFELRTPNLDAAERLFRERIKAKAQAEEELKIAHESNPRHVETHYALGRAYQQMGRKEDAQREFEVCSQLTAQRQKMQSGIAGQNP
jgi:tetratricopeptide (TPR) repeat protein